MKNIQTTVVLLLSALCACGNMAAQTAFTINDPRPVAAAMDRLEAIYAVPITYEDTFYVNDGEIKDITETLNRDLGRRVLVPKGGTLEFFYTPPAEDATREERMNLAAAAITQALSAFNRPRKAEMFSVTQADGVFHVFARALVNASGTPEATTPIFDTRISFTPSQQNAAATVEAFTQALSTALNKPVWYGGLASNLFRRTPTDITASDEPARVVLDRLVSEIHPVVPSEPGPDGGTQNIAAAMSWRLLCDPNPQLGCALSLHVVQPPASERKFKTNN